MKLLLSDFPPLTLRGASSFVGWLGLLAWVRWRGIRLSVPRRWWPTLVAGALLNITGWLGFTILGLQYMNAAHGVIVGYTMPAWTALFAALLLGERATVPVLAALGCGMAGIALLFAPGIPAAAASPVGTGLVLCAAISWALGTILIKRLSAEIPVLTHVTWQILIGATPLLVAGLSVENAEWGRVDAAGWARFLLFAFYPLCLCYILWFWSLSVLPATVASIAGLVSPAAGVALSALVLGEPLGIGESAALALILVAIGLLILRPRSA